MLPSVRKRKGAETEHTVCMHPEKVVIINSSDRHALLILVITKQGRSQEFARGGRSQGFTQDFVDVLQQGNVITGC